MEASSQGHEIEVGFKSLTLCCPKNNDQKLHHNSCIMASNLMSPPPSPAFSHIGDYIGMESCLDMKKCEDVHMMNVDASTTTTTTPTPTHTQHARSSGSSCGRNSRTKKAREYPPPISLFARTENLPSHMLFVLKRYYTNDGRLILREERARRHEYFRAHRSNGHLTLQLVHLDDDYDDDDDDDDAFFPPLDDGNESEHQYAPELAEERAVAEVQVEAKEEEEEEIEGLISQIPESSNDNEGIGGMCLKYNNVIISSPCYLGVPVPAVKPVQT